MNAGFIGLGCLGMGIIAYLSTLLSTISSPDRGGQLCCTNPHRFGSGSDTDSVETWDRWTQELRLRLEDRTCTGRVRVLRDRTRRPHSSRNERCRDRGVCLFPYLSSRFLIRRGLGRRVVKLSP